MLGPWSGAGIFERACDRIMFATLRNPFDGAVRLWKRRSAGALLRLLQVGGVFQTCRVAVEEVGLVPSTLSVCLLTSYFQNNTAAAGYNTPHSNQPTSIIWLIARLGGMS
jgi:hypothetical protein